MEMEIKMSRYLTINIGDIAEIKHIITQQDIEKFVDLTGDDNKIHTDKGYASTTTFKKPVATSNQALFWSSIRKIGIKDSIPNYGKLLTKSYN